MIQQPVEFFEKVEACNLKNNKDVSDYHVRNLINKHLYTKLVEEYTTDKEFIDKFVHLYDFGFTDFKVNKQMLKDKSVDVNAAIEILLA